MYKSPLFINNYLSLQAVSDGLFRNKERSNFQAFLQFTFKI